MTPKEKAKELVETFIPHARDWKSIHGLWNAKQIALICVDEIMKESSGTLSKRYYIEVKHEINRRKV